MILSDQTIKKMLIDKELIIEPLSEYAIQPASIDCRLGSHFLIIDDTGVGIMTLEQEVKYREINSQEIIIPPKSFILATTQEYVKLPNNLAAFVEGRSSIGRLGLFIQNAGWIDAGFEGNITLELYNANSLPIKLRAGRRVCQLVFCDMDQPVKLPYRGKYQGQRQTIGSKIFQDEDK